MVLSALPKPVGSYLLSLFVSRCLGHLLSPSSQTSMRDHCRLCLPCFSVYPSWTFSSSLVTLNVTSTPATLKSCALASALASGPAHPTVDLTSHLLVQQPLQLNVAKAGSPAVSPNPSLSPLSLHTHLQSTSKSTFLYLQGTPQLHPLLSVAISTPLVRAAPLSWVPAWPLSDLPTPSSSSPQSPFSASRPQPASPGANGPFLEDCF